MEAIGDVKRRKLMRALAKIHELSFYEGNRHTKVTCVHNGRVTMIPRHRIVWAPTFREIVK